MGDCHSNRSMGQHTCRLFEWDREDEPVQIADARQLSDAGLEILGPNVKRNQDCIAAAANQLSVDHLGRANLLD
jgi:hypothetical protein